jgi:hypothetical protein
MMMVRRILSTLMMRKKCYRGLIHPSLNLCGYTVSFWVMIAGIIGRFLVVG